jgi:hypothetical protein
MHGAIGKREAMRARQVLLNLPIAAKAPNVSEALSEFVQDGRRQ